MKKLIFFVLMTSCALAAGQTRNPLKRPFSSHSIWNMPIGSEAVYVPANLPNYADVTPRPWNPMPQMDDELIIMHPEVDEVPVARNGTGWNNPNRCVPDGTTPTLHFKTLPIPPNYTVPNSSKNNSAAVLSKGGRFVYQLQPLTKCAGLASATALLDFPPVDIYGSGHSGAHGGSGMSAVGGSLRIGELRPGQEPPHHALKVDVDSVSVMHPCTVKSDCYRWPAYGADSYAAQPGIGYGSKASVTPPAAMKMGALLALPPSVDIAKIGLETPPAMMLAWTMQNYGAYIVDSTGGPGFAIAAENGPDGNYRDQFKADWNMAFEGWVASNTPWTRDIGRIVVLLSVIDNNALNSIGGGGIPLQPLAPEIAPPN